ncbi:SRPBCC family protein [Rothia nasimurium]|uniref:SRPBCC family protein n=1 Tax=Rothia nasimurium TaxID=85336 RepID=UPI001F1F06D8|nr:SRPBCC domain-containing protein [Rothia nasimurium]
MNFDFGTIAPEDALTFTHDFEATPEALYEAFTSAELMPQWFGPEGFTVPLDTVDIDVREGGAQKFVMVSEENPEFTSPVNGTFHKLVPGELIEGYEAICEELAEAHGMEAGSYFLNRTSFEKIDENTTRVTITQGPMDPAMHEMSVAGWKSSFNKLNRLLTA